MQAQGWEPYRAGGGYKLKQDPSIHIYPHTNTFKDYGKTQAQGDIIEFVKVFENKDFQEAVQSLVGGEINLRQFEKKPLPPPKPFVLPEQAPSNRNAIAYLKSRGVDREIALHCVHNKILYESLPYHNAVYVGYDKEGVARFAAAEQTHLQVKGKRFKQDVAGSMKAHSFAMIPKEPCSVLGVYESPLDAISHATLRKSRGKDWQASHYLSLGGVSPKALDRYLKDRPEIKTVGLCLDNDEAGRQASEGYKVQLEILGYEVIDAPPQHGKDYNDWCKHDMHQRQKKAEHSR